MKGLRAERWGKAILSVSPSPLFLSQGWESCASHSVPHLSSIYLFSFPLSSCPPTTLSILPLLTSPLLSSIRLHSKLYLSLCLTFASFPVFIHPALSPFPPPSLIRHPSPYHFSPLISPINHPTQCTHTPFTAGL